MYDFKLQIKNPNQPARFHQTLADDEVGKTAIVTGQWYLYGDLQTTDASGDPVEQQLMLRETQVSWAVNGATFSEIAYKKTVDEQVIGYGIANSNSSIWVTEPVVKPAFTQTDPLFTMEFDVRRTDLDQNDRFVRWIWSFFGEGSGQARYPTLEGQVQFV